METTHIEKLLTTVSDQILANLQAACDDGKLIYLETCHCLLGFCGGQTEEGYRDLLHTHLGGMAEMEFLYLGRKEFAPIPFASWSKENDPIRIKYLLPLIHNEWRRRSQTHDEQGDELPDQDPGTAEVLSHNNTPLVLA